MSHETLHSGNLPENFSYRHNCERLVTFDHQILTRQLLYKIRSEGSGGPQLVDEIRTLAAIIGQSWLHTYNRCDSVIEDGPYGQIERPVITNPPTIIGIPRGGVPMAEGVSMVSPDSQLLFTNAGKNKDPNKRLLPENLPTKTSHIIICDTVVGTGDTVANTIQELSIFFPTINISLFSAIASEVGTRRLSNEFPNLTIYAACLESKYELINIDGKSVFFVHGIGDVGDMVSRK